MIVDATSVEILKIVRLNCKHEFSCDTDTAIGSVHEMYTTYKCKRCSGTLTFHPFDKELNY